MPVGLAQRLFRTGTAALLVYLIAWPIAPAAAQSFLDLLFGPRHARPAPPPLPGNAYAPPDREPFSGRFRGDYEPARPTGGRTAQFCVRLCDGRFFPLSRPEGNMTPVQLCNAFCPASPTKVMTGRAIDTARGADGKAYDDLPNAFVYRDKVVSGCTCNGKDPFGLARIDIEDDPTLQKGDIVAVNGTLQAYTGQKRSRTAGEFTPIEDYTGLSRTLRSKLEQTPVGED